MNLTPENYYSDVASYEYMSVSQFKDFAGTYGRLGCEAMAMAKIRGEFQQKSTTPLMVGSYVDTYFEGPESFAHFKSEHPEILTASGGLRAEYRQAERIIHRIEQDELFMKCMSGEKQVIMTGELFGVPWKIKMDSYIPDRLIVDLKVIKSIRKLEWVRDLGYLDFVRYWGYDVQGAIYQEIVYQNTGKRLPFYIAAASKEVETDIEVIHVWDSFLKEAMRRVEFNMNRIKAVKYGGAEPDRCGRCEYCLRTKKLTDPISLLNLVERNQVE